MEVVVCAPEVSDLRPEDGLPSTAFIRGSRAPDTPCSFARTGTDSLLMLWDASASSLPSTQPPSAPGVLPPNASNSKSSGSRPSSRGGGGDSAQAIPQRNDPLMAYTAPGEVDSVAWGVGGEWVGCAGGYGSGRGGGWVRSLKV